MEQDRVIDLGEDVRNHVFEMLDAEPGMTGIRCGAVAKAVEEAFLAAMQDDSEPDDRCPSCGWCQEPVDGCCYECGAPHGSEARRTV